METLRNLIAGPSSTQLNGQYLNAQENNIKTYVPPTASPGYIEAKPVLTLSQDYQVTLVVRVKTQINPSKPVDRFNDYAVWFDYTVLKIENGQKRAIGAGMVGEISAIDSKQRGGCRTTIALLPSRQTWTSDQS